MKTQIAIKKAGSVRKLAGLFDVSPQAVRKWGDDLPPLRDSQLREMRAEWYPAKKNPKQL